MKEKPELELDAKRRLRKDDLEPWRCLGIRLKSLPKHRKRHTANFWLTAGLGSPHSVSVGRNFKKFLGERAFLVDLDVSSSGATAVVDSCLPIHFVFPSFCPHGSHDKNHTSHHVIWHSYMHSKHALPRGWHDVLTWSMLPTLRCPILLVHRLLVFWFANSMAPSINNMANVLGVSGNLGSCAQKLAKRLLVAESECAIARQKKRKLRGLIECDGTSIRSYKK